MPSAPVRPAVPVRPAPAPTMSPVAKSCRECGKALTDPFDQALGACESCRQKLQKPTPAPAPESRSVEVIDLPPMGASNAPAPEAFPSADPRVAAPPPVLAPEPRSAARSTGQRTGVAVTANSGGGGRKALVAALVLLLVGGGGAAAYFLVPGLRAVVDQKVEGGKPPATANTPAASAPLPPAVEAVLPRWQLMFVDGQTGDSKQLVEQGQALLLKDQRTAYAQALELFQRAVLADPRNDAAIGGYVEALSLGRGALMNEATYQEARSLIEAAEERSHRKPGLLVAHANLLLSRPGETANAEQARRRLRARSSCKITDTYLHRRDCD